MNKVKRIGKGLRQLKLGDLIEIDHLGSKKIYLVCAVVGEYLCVSLEDGGTWDYAQKSLSKLQESLDKDGLMGVVWKFVDDTISVTPDH